MLKLKLLLTVLIITVYTVQPCAAEQSDLYSRSAFKGLVFKKFQAWAKYRDGDYNDALKRYNELSKLKPNDAFYNYMLGKCYLALNNYDESILSFEKSFRINPRIKKDLPLQAGIAYHKKGDLDNALKNYNLYISTLSPKQLQRDELVMDYVNSILTARELKSNPVNVTITKLSSNVNSDYDDASPGLSPDGKTLYFTSRRTIEGLGKIIAGGAANNDKMFVSKWDEQSQGWGKSELADNEFNKLGHIGSLSLSHDGKTIFIYKNIPGKTKGGDIFYSELMSNGKWSDPIDIGKPINTTYFESSAAISPDGNTLYFVSERKGGFGNADIYRSQRLSTNKWSAPENLKAVINSPYDELDIFVHPDGKTLYFSSNGHRTMGGYDIFMSTFENGSWTQPINLGYPINSEFDEKHFSLSSDGKKAYISSNRSGVFDIYEVDMTNYGIKRSGESVMHYVHSTQKTEKTDLKTDTRKTIDVIIDVVNNSNNKTVASFNSANKGEYALKLKNNEIYSISFTNKNNETNIAVIKTHESGDYIIKTSDAQEFLINVDNSRRHSLLKISLLE